MRKSCAARTPCATPRAPRTDDPRRQLAPALTPRPAAGELATSMRYTKLVSNPLDGEHTSSPGFENPGPYIESVET